MLCLPRSSYCAPNPKTQRLRRDAICTPSPETLVEHWLCSCWVSYCCFFLIRWDMWDDHTPCGQIGIFHILYVTVALYHHFRIVNYVHLPFLMSKQHPNHFFLLLKLLQIKNWTGVALPFCLVRHNWILNYGNWESIGEQDGETMGSTHINILIKINCHLEFFFFLRVQSDKFYFLFLLLRFSLEY